MADEDPVAHNFDRLGPTHYFHEESQNHEHHSRVSSQLQELSDELVALAALAAVVEAAHPV